MLFGRDCDDADDDDGRCPTSRMRSRRGDRDIVLLGWVLVWLRVEREMPDYSEGFSSLQETTTAARQRSRLGWAGKQAIV